MLALPTCPFWRYHPLYLLILDSLEVCVFILVCWSLLQATSGRTTTSGLRENIHQRLLMVTGFQVLENSHNPILLLSVTPRTSSSILTPRLLPLFPFSPHSSKSSLSITYTRTLKIHYSGPVWICVYKNASLGIRSKKATNPESSAFFQTSTLNHWKASATLCASLHLHWTQPKLPRPLPETVPQPSPCR